MLGEVATLQAYCATCQRDQVLYIYLMFNRYEHSIQVVFFLNCARSYAFHPQIKLNFGYVQHSVTCNSLLPGTSTSYPISYLPSMLLHLSNITTFQCVYRIIGSALRLCKVTMCLLSCSKLKHIQYCIIYCLINKTNRKPKWLIWTFSIRYIGYIWVYWNIKL